MLQSVFELAIDIDLGSTERAYFSLCDQFQNQGSDYKVNYNSCLYRGALTDGKLSSAIKVANHQTELLAVLWKYDGSAPRFQLWQHQQGTNPKLTINN
ncbi:hypothetical protein FLM48_14950 [Shewanella sp. Scap07]|nr:hypothetical protein FLM48_14950 [Shewanella sp. Scap07]